MSLHAEATRDLLAELVRSFPGLHVQELARQAGMSKQLAGYHLRLLVQDGRLQELRDRDHLRYFTLDEAGMTNEDRGIIVLLRQPHLLNLMLILLETKAATNGDLAEATGLSKSTVSHHVAHLVGAGAVQSTRNGLGFELADPRLVRRMLLRWQPPTTITDKVADVWGRFYAAQRRPKRAE